MTVVTVLVLEDDVEVMVEEGAAILHVLVALTLVAVAVIVWGTVVEVLVAVTLVTMSDHAEVVKALLSSNAEQNPQVVSQ
mmetsp:Transcript_21405/g.53584  ORF Transcript_21405/g.53584 Transcript_21405/m.53584 type:complete len:80 (+) Transcript_21405:49-288(+)